MEVLLQVSWTQGSPKASARANKSHRRKSQWFSTVTPIRVTAGGEFKEPTWLSRRGGHEGTWPEAPPNRWNLFIKTRTGQTATHAHNRLEQGEYGSDTVSRRSGRLNIKNSLHRFTEETLKHVRHPELYLLQSGYWLSNSHEWDSACKSRTRL